MATKTKDQTSAPEASPSAEATLADLDAEAADLRRKLEAAQHMGDARLVIQLGARLNEIPRRRREAELRALYARRAAADQHIRLVGLKIGDLPERIAQADKEVDDLLYPLTMRARYMHTKGLMTVEASELPPGVGGAIVAGIVDDRRNTPEYRAYLDGLAARNALARELKPLDDERRRWLAEKAATEKAIAAWLSDAQAET